MGGVMFSITVRAGIRAALQAALASIAVCGLGNAAQAQDGEDGCYLQEWDLEGRWIPTGAEARVFMGFIRTTQRQPHDIAVFKKHAENPLGWFWIPQERWRRVPCDQQELRGFAGLLSDLEWNVSLGVSSTSTSAS